MAPSVPPKFTLKAAVPNVTPGYPIRGVEPAASPDDLPKPLWPKFPLEFADKLPKGVSPTNVYKVCVCWNCAPALWQELAAHTSRFSPFIKNDQDVRWPYLALRGSCDIRSIMQFFIKYWDGLTIESLSSRQKKALEIFNKNLGELQLVMEEGRWEDIPPLSTFAKSMDTVFFQDCLEGTTDYAWVTSWGNPKEGDPVKSSQYGGTRRTANMFMNQICIVPIGHPDAGVPCKCQRGEECSPRCKIERMTGTLLHEMVHALSHHYLCNGDCAHGTTSQKALCAYLYARTVAMFDCVEYGNERRDNNRFNGHGPAFHVLCRQLRETATPILGLKQMLDIGGIVRNCACPTHRPSACLSHCSFWHRDCQKYILRDFDDEKGEKDEQGKKEEKGKNEFEKDVASIKPRSTFI